MTNGVDYAPSEAGVAETRAPTRTEAIHHITPNPRCGKYLWPTLYASTNFS